MAYKALGALMTETNDYTNQASFQLYDTSGSVEDWSYWQTGGLGFTFEIGPDSFHPAYETLVVPPGWRATNDEVGNLIIQG